MGKRRTRLCAHGVGELRLCEQLVTPLDTNTRFDAVASSDTKLVSSLDGILITETTPPTPHLVRAPDAHT